MIPLDTTIVVSDSDDLVLLLRLCTDLAFLTLGAVFAKQLMGK